MKRLIKMPGFIKCKKCGINPRFFYKTRKWRASNICIQCGNKAMVKLLSYAKEDNYGKKGDGHSPKVK